MNPVVFAGSIIILLFSVIVHEVMHGLAARRFGDHTAERAGRLTLNPIPHIDPIGTILLPLLLVISGSPVLFGWAKPVPVNPLNFSDIRKGELVTSSAGVLANFAIAIAAALIFHLLPSFSDITLASLLVYAARINLVLAIFNLLPIPPLDGSKIVLSFLPVRLAVQFQALEKYGLLILLLLWFVPLGSSSVLGVVLGFFLSLFRALLGV